MRKIGSLSLQPLKQQFHYTALLFACALAVAWLGNPLLARVAAPAEYAFALCMSAIGLVLTVYACHLLGKAGYLFAFVYTGVVFAFSFATSQYSIEPGPSFVGAIWETTVEEAGVFFSLRTVAFFSCLFLGVLFFIHSTRRLFSPWNIFILLLLVAHIIFAQARIFTRGSTKDMRHAARWSIEYMADPFKYTSDYFRKDKKRIDLLRKLPDPTLPAPLRNNSQPLTVVIVIGESLRADRLGINGYYRDTTPGLAKEKLVNYPKALSYAAWTRESAIGMLTDIPLNTKESRHGSFVKVFQKLGFSVATYNANTKPNRSDFSLSILTEGAQRFFAARPDLNLVEKMKPELGKHPLELHILSPYGSHYSYRDAYPAQDAVFVPEDYARPMRMDEMDKINNAYDNTVYYTDKMLCNIIELLREKRAVLMYMSDHGESLGEEGRFMHGDNNAPEQRHVPFFFWFSDTYRQEHPEVIAAMQSKTGQQVYHSHVFHTLLGIAGIETPVKDRVYDLTQPE